jgi:beta propeller repeat protein
MNIYQFYKERIIFSLLLVFFCFIFYFSDQAQSQEIQITTDVADQYRPDIWENYIVYTDMRNGNADIYRFDLSN